MSYWESLLRGDGERDAYIGVVVVVLAASLVLTLCCRFCHRVFNRPAGSKQRSYSFDRQDPRTPQLTGRESAPESEVGPNAVVMYEDSPAM